MGVTGDLHAATVVIAAKFVAVVLVLVGCACIYDIIRQLIEDWEWRQRMIRHLRTYRGES